MPIASEKCYIFSTPLFCPTIHTVSLSTKEFRKSTSGNFLQPLVLWKGYCTSHTILISTEFYNNLIAKCWEKVWKRRITFLPIWFFFDSPMQQRSWEEHPHQPVCFKISNMFQDRRLRKEGLQWNIIFEFLLYNFYLEYSDTEIHYY